jgi:hypothetical protein
MDTILYGLRAWSNVPLPWCTEVAEGPPDLRIYLGPSGPVGMPPPEGDAPLWYASPFVDEAGNPAAMIRRSPDGILHLTYSDGSTFHVDPDGREVRACWDAPEREQSTLAYLLGPVLGWVLRLRGITCLHASALEVGGRALLLVGSEGAGKSTTAAALLQRGHAVLSDDVAPLSGRGDTFWISPGLPRLLLRAESAFALWGDGGAAPPLFPGSDKGYVDSSAPFFRHCGRALPLGGVYFLESRVAGLDRPRIERVTGAAGLSRLAANAFANRVPNPAMLRADFERFGRLLNNYPVKLVTARDDLRGLDELCAALVEDFLSELKGFGGLRP